jgi:hypothetical protein
MLWLRSLVSGGTDEAKRDYIRTQTISKKMNTKLWLYCLVSGGTDEAKRNYIRTQTISKKMNTKLWLHCLVSGGTDVAKRDYIRTQTISQKMNTKLWLHCLVSGGTDVAKRDYIRTQTISKKMNTKLWLSLFGFRRNWWGQEGLHPYSSYLQENEHKVVIMLSGFRWSWSWNRWGCAWPRGITSVLKLSPRKSTQSSLRMKAHRISNWSSIGNTLNQAVLSKLLIFL